jgi:hypothetical protein
MCKDFFADWSHIFFYSFFALIRLLVRVKIEDTRMGNCWDRKKGEMLKRYLIYIQVFRFRYRYKFSGFHVRYWSGGSLLEFDT